MSRTLLEVGAGDHPVEIGQAQLQLVDELVQVVLFQDGLISTQHLLANLVEQRDGLLVARQMLQTALHLQQAVIEGMRKLLVLDG